jgi:thiol-disulfide isomerase/thioredoxin
MKIFFVRSSLLALLFFAATANANPAPDFTLKSNSDQNIRLAEQRGKVVMLNFWASWCGPCRKEMPLLDEMHTRYNKAGLELYGVNVEQNTDDAEKLLKELGTGFPILWDRDSKVSKLYQVNAMPTTIMIDKDGKVRYVNRGYKAGDEEKYREQIRELIRE